MFLLEYSIGLVFHACKCLASQITSNWSKEHSSWVFFPLGSISSITSNVATHSYHKTTTAAHCHSVTSRVATPFSSFGRALPSRPIRWNSFPTSGAHGTKLSLHQPFCSGVGVRGQPGPHPHCFPEACAHLWVRWPMNPPCRNGAAPKVLVSWVISAASLFCFSFYGCCRFCCTAFKHESVQTTTTNGNFQKIMCQKCFTF